jgi:hypothetical protein
MLLPGPNRGRDADISLDSMFASNHPEVIAIHCMRNICKSQPAWPPTKQRTRRRKLFPLLSGIPSQVPNPYNPGLFFAK